MSEKGMMFTTELVQAILNGRKTQTRRVISKFHETSDTYVGNYHQIGDFLNCFCWHKNGSIPQEYIIEKFSKYQVDDIIYVKEKCGYLPILNSDPLITDFDNQKLYYAADDNPELSGINIKWGNPMFMKRKFARLFLRVTDVRVERLQDISAADVRAEGIKAFTYNFLNFPCIPSTLTEKHICNSSGMFDDNSRRYREWYADLWNKINGKKNKGAFKWDMNPFVFVYSFERVRDYT